MSAPLSVVIPTLQAAGELPATLDALLEGAGSGLIGQLVLSDGGSTDATARIAEAAGAVWITGPPGRGGQLRRGVAAADRDWLLLLHADTQLPAGWPGRVLERMNNRADRATAFTLRFRSRHPMARVTEGWARLRSDLLGLPYGDQGLLISRAALAAAGGVPDLPLMEDVALARRLRGRLVRDPMRVTTSAARYAAEGWGRRGARNLLLLARYGLGADPDALARAYRPNRD